jgi:anti-sigma regulatory factor (Ser/Thr protein kinase)
MRFAGACSELRERGGRVRPSDGPSQTSAFELRLPAEAAQIPVARRAIAEFCTRCGLPSHVIDDVKLVVTEACTNVVLHAYEGEAVEDPAFELRARVEDDALVVTVSDDGRGIGASSRNRGLGLGLRLALQLAGGVHTSDTRAGRGTCLTMRFALHG